MITLIGLVAGEIWSYLDAHDSEAKISEMIEDMGREKEIMLMSLGWLAREGHIILDGDAPDYLVKLKH